MYPKAQKKASVCHLFLTSQSHKQTGLLPFSHIYGLIVLIHVGPYRGDGVVVMPRYDFAGMLQSIQRYKINILYLVPPMIIHMINQREACKKYDLSSVRAAFSGAAPLGKSTIAELNALFPEWAVRQGVRFFPFFIKRPHQLLFRRHKEGSHEHSHALERVFPLPLLTKILDIRSQQWLYQC